MKRGNANAQMRREEYEADDGPEESAGSFRKADASHLQGRKIRKARRTAKTQNTAEVPAAAAKSSNPFAGGWSFGGGGGSTSAGGIITSTRLTHECVLHCFSEQHI